MQNADFQEAFSDRFGCCICLCPKLKMVTGHCQHRICEDCIYVGDERRSCMENCPVCHYANSFPKQRPIIPQASIEMQLCLGVQACPNKCSIQLWFWEVEEHLKTCEEQGKKSEPVTSDLKCSPAKKRLKTRLTKSSLNTEEIDVLRAQSSPHGLTQAHTRGRSGSTVNTEHSVRITRKSPGLGRNVSERQSSSENREHPPHQSPNNALQTVVRRSLRSATSREEPSTVTGLSAGSSDLTDSRVKSSAALRRDHTSTRTGKPVPSSDCVSVRDTLRSRPIPIRISRSRHISKQQNTKRQVKRSAPVIEHLIPTTSQSVPRSRRPKAWSRRRR